jgi:hypothetical protein
MRIRASASRHGPKCARGNTEYLDRHLPLLEIPHGFARHVKTVVKIAVFGLPRLGNPAEPPHQRLPNGTGEASGGRPSVPFLGRLAVGTDLPAGSGCSNDSRQP